jgi:hypothetical protein
MASVAIWLPVMILTPPEAESTLRSFYRRVRPGGPGWGDHRRATRLRAADNLRLDAFRVVAGLALLFGLMFAVGGALLLRPGVAGLNAALAGVGWVALRRMRPEPPEEGHGGDDVPIKGDATPAGARGRGRPGR